MISSKALTSIPDLRKKFEAAEPFKHVAIDSFLNERIARGLVKEFPAFDTSRARTEFGDDGGKDVFEKISGIGPTYKEVSDFMGSKEMSTFLTEVTGIQDLVWGGEDMYGGGTHENIHGQDLDHHIDFNYDDRNGYHRRLNVLLYLNDGWQEEWGGALQLHKNPRDPENDWFVAFPPIYNRVLIHETTEHSWHGFRRVMLPPEERHRSRRSLALYFYTKERGEQEIVGGHATHYVHWPLSDSVKPGQVLSEGDYLDISQGYLKRDSFLADYQAKETRQAAAIAYLQSLNKTLVDRAFPALEALSLMPGSLKGYEVDEWITTDFLAKFTATKDLKAIEIKGFVHEMRSGDYSFEVTCGKITDTFEYESAVGPVSFVINGLSLLAGDEFEIRVKTRKHPVFVVRNGDNRPLSILLSSVIGIEADRHPE